MRPSAAGPQGRILAVLAATQVLAGVGIATALAVATLLAARMSGSDLVGGSALTAVVVGTAVAALLVSRIATRRGRRPALSAGYGVGALGGAGAAAAIAVGSVALLLVSLFLIGSATAAGLAARFAATDLAAPDRRARSLALVVWATTVGAVAGPNLASPVQDLAGGWGLVPATGPFLLCTAAFGLAAAGTWLGLRPDPLLLARERDAAVDSAALEFTGGSVAAPPRTDGAAARAALRASPAALLGFGGVALGHLVMIGLMSMTPVHMDHGGAALSVVGLVISLHVAGMYALSPLFGWLADRLGREPVLVLAALLLVVAGLLCAVAGPTDTGLLGAGLVLLGLGWSAGLVAGSALVGESVPAGVRPGVQGLTDVAMNVAGAVGGIAAGLVVAGTSFALLGVLAAVLVGPYLLFTVGTLRRPRAVAVG